MQKDLVFDIGAHRGEDSAYYLRRGFRVVSVECDPDHVSHLRRRFKAEMANSQLTLVDSAIGPQTGEIKFFRNKNVSVWGTADRSWADRNISYGTEVEEVVVKSIMPRQLFQDYGIPYYLKIDVEGLDMLVLRSLEEFTPRPAYVSIESNANSFDNLRREFATFSQLGYHKFKLSPQHMVQVMKVPPLSVHGTECDYIFEEHSSGPFGEDLKGPWLSEREAIAEYKSVFVLYDLYDALRTGVLHGSVRDFQKGYGHDAGGHYDTHARHSSVEGILACM